MPKAKPETAAPTAPRGLGRLRRRQEREGPSAFARFRQSYEIAHKHDRLILAWAVGIALIPLAILVVLGVVLSHVVILPIVGVVLSVLVGFNVYAWRAQRAVYAEVADRPGVSLEVIRRLRGGWKITEAVQFNRNQDFVHRVVSRAGVVLIGEGRYPAVRELMAAEARRTRRVASDTPLHEIIVGSGPDAVALPKLRATLTRLPRTLKPVQVKALDVKLKAVANTSLPIPKGPMPTRMPRGRQR